ncbi:MAG: 4-hydroxy-tetrahydrodipicolinate reductase [Deltaproteobacteria bacterium]|nr:4-hydroxy-tetrahydrodipicolinate reductase [Deltaproteobacteria bacterium]
MGSAVVRLLREAPGLAPARLDSASVIVDYSHPDWTGPLIDKLLERPRPAVIGTTGLSPAMEAKLLTLSERVPVVRAANTGTGIHILKELVAQAVRLAGPGWDVEILEMHHRRKVDAPSGTAWMLLETAAGGGRERAVPARVGETGARTDEEIGVQTLRGGDVVGEHTVYLVGHGERIELTHRCWDRDTFARGGLRAARWAAEPDRAAGLYSMSDVLA